MSKLKTREQLRKELEFYSLVSQATLQIDQLDKLLYVILAGITHLEYLGFNRAFLFLADEKGTQLSTSMIVGPPNAEAAQCIWKEMENQKLDIKELSNEFTSYVKTSPTHFLAYQFRGFTLPLLSKLVPVVENEYDVPVQALLLRCALRKEPFLSNSIKAMYPPIEDSSGEPLEFSRIAILPLVSQNKVLGILLVDNHYTNCDISIEDLRALTTISNLIAFIIEKCRLSQKIEEVSVLDGLTKVGNRQYYTKRIKEEITRAYSARYPLAMLLTDIDYFQKCNTTYGHERGDKVLQELAFVIKQSVRSEDVVARYGGEEFAVLLTGGTTVKEAMCVAEALRAKIASSSFAEFPKGKITISVGGASLSPQKLKEDELLRKAEQALDQAKKQGRNRVVIN